MSEEFYCGKCQRPLDERELKEASVQVTEVCPHCGEFVRKSDRWRWSNETAAVQGDVSYIDGWLSEATQALNLKVERDRTAEAMGDYLWQVSGIAAPWCLEIAYRKRSLGSATIALLTTELGDEAEKAIDRLRGVFADHGLEPCGTKGPDGVRWGAQQRVTVDQVSVPLLKAVVKRLEAAMKDATTFLKPR